MDARLTILLAVVLAVLLPVAASVARTCSVDEPPPPPPESAEVAADRAVLVAIYHAKGGENWYEPEKINWLTDAPLGEWFGVTTGLDGRVTELVILQGMTGPIPPEFGMLTRLERLILGGYQRPHGGRNRLSGPIPPELGRLTRLKELGLENNELSGVIPLGIGQPGPPGGAGPRRESVERPHPR